MGRFADAVGMGTGLVVVWLLLSGHTDPLLLALGGASCGLVLLLAWRMRILGSEAPQHRIAARLPGYLPWLLWEIVKANVHVARIILTPSLPIGPRLIRVRASQHSDLGLTIHANSITLTPGTLSLDVREGQILVHALTEASAEGLVGGEMDRRVAALERPR